MRLEKLVSPKGALSVGIAELQNERKLGKDALIKNAIEVSGNILAVQMLNPYLIVDTHHLLSAAQNAVNAWYGKYAQARTLDIEIAIFASGQKQIGRALDTFGVSEGMNTVAVVIVDEKRECIMECYIDLQERIGPVSETQFSSDETRLMAIMKQFDIEKPEIMALTDTDDLPSIQSALSRCVVSRVTSVALES